MGHKVLLHEKRNDIHVEEAYGAADFSKQASENMAP